MQNMWALAYKRMGKRITYHRNTLRIHKKLKFGDVCQFLSPYFTLTYVGRNMSDGRLEFRGGNKVKIRMTAKTYRQFIKQ